LSCLLKALIPGIYFTANPVVLFCFFVFFSLCTGREWLALSNAGA
jgi:hypothetical protein